MHFQRRKTLSCLKIGTVMNNFYKIPEALLQALLQYLAQRPYAEVAQAIAELQKLEKVDE